MSGGGGGGGGGVEPPAALPCAKLIFKTVLNSPDAKVLAKLSSKERLDLSLKTARGPVVASTSAGEVAGSITSVHLARLVECMSEGHEFVAVVISVTKARCEVEVRPKR